MAATETAAVTDAIPEPVVLTEKKIYNTAYQREYVQRYGPLSTISAGAPIEFEVKGNDKGWIDFTNHELKVKIKITKADGTDFKTVETTAATKFAVAPVNNIFHSLWQTVEVRLNEHPLYDANQLYAYRAYITNLFCFSEQVQNTRLVTEGFDKDDEGDVDDVDPTSTDARALNARYKLYQSSATNTFVGRLHIDIANFTKLIPPNINIKIRLVPSPNDFVLIDNDSTTAFALKILDASLNVPFIELNPELQLAQEKALDKVNYQINFNRVSLKTENIPTGVTQFMRDNLFTGTLPELIAIGLVDDKAVSGDVTTNPFYFEHAKITDLYLTVNGTHLPAEGLHPDFANGDYHREYLYMQESLGYLNSNTAANLTPSEWANGCTVFFFKNIVGPFGAIQSPPRTGNIRLEIKFGAATTKNYKLIIMSHGSAHVEFTKFHQVIY